MLVTSFDEVFNKNKHVVSMAIYKCKIYKNREHYEQIGYIALWNAYNQFNGVEEEFEPYAYVFVKNAILTAMCKHICFMARWLSSGIQKEV